MKTTTYILVICSAIILTSCSGKKNGSQSPFTTPSTNNGSATPTPTPIPTNPGGGGATPTPIPTPISTPVPTPTPPPDLSAGSIIVNNNQKWTTGTSVFLTLEKFEAKKMKISNDEDCATGAWETFTPNKVWPLSKLNQSVAISAQFIDFENRTTACTTAKISHDSLPPSLSLRLDPLNSYFSGKTTRLFFSTSDLGIGPKSVICKINTNVVACPQTTTQEVPLDFIYPSGAYFFEVTAVDLLGNTSTQQIGWTIKDEYKDVHQKLSIKSNTKVDILFVIDNSASMEEEQKSMAQRISRFSSQIAGLDWQIGITTTDPQDKTLGDGRLVPYKGLNNQYVIDSKMDPSQAQKVLGQTLQRDEVGSSNEQGIYATYRALERSLDSTSGPNRTLIRSDAALATIVISDEDESAQGPKNDPNNLLAFTKKTWNSEKNFVFHSIIVKPGDQKCLNQQQTVYGSQYAKMSSLTGQDTVGGAIVGSVCESDYGNQLAGIGKSIQQMHQTLTLSCEPIDKFMTILVNGVQLTDPFDRVGLKLVFKTNLQPGSYELDYHCAN